jgi:spermidine synthase
MARPALTLPEAESPPDFSARMMLVALLFFFSGASSLIYQVIWTRQMVFVFGSSTFATATVLSAFMGGLALGSFAAGKLADRVRNPFLIYGLLEGIIGIWALAAPFMFSGALPLYKLVYQHLHLSVLPFSLLRFAVVSLILLVPTACMGATLPLLAKFVTTTIARVAASVGTLYAINTLGAVGGCLAGGFLLIPLLGLQASTWTAAAVNLLLAASVLALVFKTAGFGPLPASPEKSLPVSESPQLKKPLGAAALATLIAFGVSGAIAMIYEVAWTRTLCLVIGSTTYAFSIMLSTFLIGIAFGSLQSSRLADRAKDPSFWFAMVQVWLALAGLASIWLFNYLPYWNLVANACNINNADLGMVVRFLLAGAVLLPVTLLFGSVFPLAVKACTQELSRLGRSIGDLYSINTLGAIVGSFAAGFLIIPYLGGEQALVCCSAASMVLGAAVLVFCRGAKLPVKIIGLLSALALTVWAAQSPQIWDIPTVVSSQKMRRGLKYSTENVGSFADFQNSVKKGFELLFWKDGHCANVAIVRFKDNNQVSLFTNGHVDASDGVGDMPTQALLPSIPLLLKPMARELADVGWGSGCTMGYALLFPIKKIVCVEIEPVVIETSRFFHKVNLNPEDDSRLRLEVNDGRNYLLATDEKFDIITSEPSNPWQAGVCNLYTQEYFQICHDRLKPAGVFAMWWQCNEVSSDNLAHVFAAIKNVFKHALVFQTFPGDIVVCAADEPLKINLKSVAEALENPRLRKQLAEHAGILAAEDLPLALLMADDGLAKVVAGVSANTDDRNLIEFDLSRNYEQRNAGPATRKWLTDNCGDIFDVVDWSGMSTKEKAVKMAALAEIAMHHHNGICEIWARQSYKVFPNSLALAVQALIAAQFKGDFEEAQALSDKAVKQYPGEVSPRLVRGIVELIGGAPLRARKDLEDALTLDPTNMIYRYRLAQTYMPELRDWYQIANLPVIDTGKADTNPQKAIELIAPSLSNSSFVNNNPTAISTVAAALLQTGRLDEGMKLMEEFRRFRPDDILALKMLAQAYSQKGNDRMSSYCSQRAADLSKVTAVKSSQGAQLLLSQKKDRLALNLLKRAINCYPASAEARAVLHEMARTNQDAANFMKELSAFSADDARAYEELLKAGGEKAGQKK